MIVLFTDFGRDGPYVGQMHGAVHHYMADSAAIGTTVIDLMHDAPIGDPLLAAYLLAAYAAPFPAGCVFVCVVDPGVGTARAPVAVRAGDQWFVGPDNGLMAIAARRAADATWFDIGWRPETLSATFHGRDLFAPCAARLAAGDLGALDLTERVGGPVGSDWPDDLLRVCQIDRFGNVITGTRASTVARDAVVAVGDKRLTYARTFGDVDAGAAMWTKNANGLLELAVNQGRADEVLGLKLADAVGVAG